MTVILNGTPTDLPDGATVHELLELNELAARPCAVEVNRALVPKRSHEAHILCDGDAIEVVTLVGGG